jgi:hypothetical protein
MAIVFGTVSGRSLHDAKRADGYASRILFGARGTKQYGRDRSILTGNPGMGFFHNAGESNADFGFSSFTAGTL